MMDKTVCSSIKHHMNKIQYKTQSSTLKSCMLYKKVISPISNDKVLFPYISKDILHSIVITKKQRILENQEIL